MQVGLCDSVLLLGSFHPAALPPLPVVNRDLFFFLVICLFNQVTKLILSTTWEYCFKQFDYYIFQGKKTPSPMFRCSSGICCISHSCRSCSFLSFVLCNSRQFSSTLANDALGWLFLSTNRNLSHFLLRILGRVGPIGNFL